jgi:hypothetical protein
VICDAMVDSLAIGEQSSYFGVINRWEDSPGQYTQASFRLKVTWLLLCCDKGVVAAMQPVFAGFLAREATQSRRMGHPLHDDQARREYLAPHRCLAMRSITRCAMFAAPPTSYVAMLGNRAWAQK